MSRRRLRLIDQEKNLQLLETPETKRRWPPPDREAEFRTAYRNWLLAVQQRRVHETRRG